MVLKCDRNTEGSRPFRSTNLRRTSIKKPYDCPFEIILTRTSANYDPNDLANGFTARAVSLIHRGHKPSIHIREHRIQIKTPFDEEILFLESLSVNRSIGARSIAAVLRERYPHNTLTTKDIYNYRHWALLEAKDSRSDTAAFVQIVEAGCTETGLYKFL